MQSSATTPQEYIDSLPEDRKAAIEKLREVISTNLPSGFEECISYGMLGWVIPHAIYAPGYHCDPKLPLPFLSIASQKNFVAVYHMGVYADAALYDWFVGEFPNHSKFKLDMGKSCIRFKKPEAIPYELIGQLVSKMTPQNWIDLYEKMLKR
ncbi:hypothetical protein AMR72_03510 [Flavobacterium psychrophilum]|nr:hypothetical protein AMR72_03510 [Flavobacterium psychrophilum]AOE51661.1 hypothetical protein ALW18_03510 [Flavobacterium psychrophilum]